MSKLNAGQKAIVTRAKGESVVLAGAGSGKTHTIIELLYKLNKKNKVPLTKMFIATFTNKAGEELRERLAKKLKIKDVEKLWVGTFHSLANRYLKQSGYGFTLLLENEASTYLEAAFDETNPAVAIDFKNVVRCIDYKRSRNCKWDEAGEYIFGAKFEDQIEIVKEVYKDYKKTKTESNLVDFHDLLYLFHKYLKQDKKFRKKFSWVVIDESQDNNAIQNKIADAFISKNKIFVGDIKQSIYEWRGATPKIFRERLKNSEVFPLSINYRSSNKIINFVNEFIQVHDQFKSQTLESVKKHRFLPEFYNCGEHETVDELLTNIKKDIKHGIPFGEISVLARSVKGEMFKQLQVMLKDNGIPYIVRGGHDLINLDYVQKYLCLVKCVVEPNRISIMTALQIIKGIGSQRGRKLGAVAHKKGVRALLKEKVPKPIETALKSFVNLMNSKEDVPQRILDKALYFLKQNYLEYAHNKTANKKVGAIKKAIIPVILDCDDLKEGINSLLLNKDNKDKVDRLVISTIHQAKGLEWESVHIPKFQKGSIPMRWSNEEFCLAYTAITRPRTRLRMYAEMKIDTESSTYANMSQFITFMFETEDRRKTFVFYDKSDIYNGITPEW